MNIKINNNKALHSIFRIIAGEVWVMVICTMLVLLEIFLHKPNSLTGWLLLILVGTPLALLAMWFGETAFSAKFGLRISKKSISLARISIALVILLVFLAVMFVLWNIFGSSIRQYFSQSSIGRTL